MLWIASPGPRPRASCCAPALGHAAQESFAEAGASDELVAALAGLGVTRPSHIQAAAFRALARPDARHVVLADHAGATRLHSPAAALAVALSGEPARAWRPGAPCCCCVCRSWACLQARVLYEGDLRGHTRRCTSPRPPVRHGRLRDCDVGAAALAAGAAAGCRVWVGSEPERQAARPHWAQRAGSGKTLAYLAPVAQALRAEEAAGGGSMAPRAPRVLVLAPTAELCAQVPAGRCRCRGRPCSSPGTRVAYIN